MPKENNKHKTYDHIIGHYSDVPLAILKSKLTEIQSFLTQKSFGIEAAQSFVAKDRPRSSQSGDVMVLQLFGTIAQRMDMLGEISGGTSIENFTKDFRNAINSPSIKAVVINIDSPGGSVFGVQELADEIYAAREKKHIVSIANSMAASAAYWLGSQADEFVVTPSGMPGSIGVYTIHDDMSEAYKQAGISSTIIQAGKYKTEGSPLAPLTEEARAAMQESVDFYYDSFVSSVARGRRATVSDVKNGFGQGRLVNSKEAKAQGMVDRIDTLDGVLSRLGVNPSATQSFRGDKKINHAIAERELALLEK